MKSDDANMLKSEMLFMDIFNIIIACSGASIEIDNTINFLSRTGMPSAAHDSIIICNYSDLSYRYFNAIDTQSRLSFDNAPYTLFLSSGAKISWGSIFALYRAARERPEAVAISAVFRSPAGRVILPKNWRRRSTFWQYVKTYFIPRSTDLISVASVFQDAVLIRRDALDAMGGQFSSYSQGCLLPKVKKMGDVICVSSAQLISLGTGDLG